MNSLNKTEKPITLPIKRIKQECADVKSFYFDINLNAKPGQFIMFWLPGVDQKPFGVSYQKNGETGITISRVGPITKKIFDLKEGDLIGLQGPYGTHYKSDGCMNLALVAGGYGAAPLSFLADYNPDKHIDFLLGAATDDRLAYRNRFEDSPDVTLHLCTDDGSCGYKGFVTDKLEEVIKNKKIDLVCACGPELMQVKVIGICERNNIPCQISLERYIKCGFGVCGQCAVDPLGIRMCREGPVISGELAGKILEFGKYKRDAAGKKTYFE